MVCIDVSLDAKCTDLNTELVGSDSGREWVIYDVGGARTQRAAWAQFFDDGNWCFDIMAKPCSQYLLECSVTAIIFLAPISGTHLFPFFLASYLNRSRSL